jgi:hypothetical protein
MEGSGSDGETMSHLVTGEVEVFGFLRETQCRVICHPHCTVTATGAEGMPLATTTSWLGPSSWVAGTSK